MIFCRFSYEGENLHGIVEHHSVLPLASDFFSTRETTGDAIPFSAIQLLAPVRPGKIVAVGVNYKKHADEMHHSLPKEPLIFLKPSSAVIGPLEEIRCPKASARVDYEGELAVVIGKKASGVRPENANAHILGYTCFNDVTARDLQKTDGQWSRAKGFDTFAPLGPWIVDDLDVSDLPIATYLNGETKQNDSTASMIFKVPELLAYISNIMTLEPGDVIATGTPEGVGPMNPGDLVDVRIEGIGTLRNGVAEAV